MPAPGAAATRPPPLTGWQQRSSQFFCLLMVFGFPIFSVPCPKGVCSSPLDVVATFAHVKTLLSEDVIRGILYPASMMQKMEVLMTDAPQNFSLPDWDSILPTWNLTSDIVEKDDVVDDFDFSFTPNLRTMFDKTGQKLNWEFVGACIICLLGGVCSIAGPNKYSMWGTLLILWYIFLDGANRQDVTVLPMYLLVLICSLGWIDLKAFFSMPVNEKPKETPAPEPNPKFEARKND